MTVSRRRPTDRSAVVAPAAAAPATRPESSAPGILPESSDPGEPPPADLLLVGRVSGTYGIRGWVRVEPQNRPEDSVLRQARRWWVRACGPRGPGAPARPEPAPRSVAIERARVHGASLVAKPEGCDDRDQALLLRGCDVLVSRADFPPGDDDEYYWTDLIGCEVHTPAGDLLGVVESVEDHGAHPLLNLLGADGALRMIPFIGVFILAVDLAARRITADWPLED